MTSSRVAPSSFSQRQLWLLDRLYGQRATYNVPSAYRLTGPLDLTRLQRSLNDVVQRHEVLRTCFRLDNGDLVQLVASALDVPIAVHDLSASPPAERLSLAMREVNADGARPFDLAALPLIRVSVHRFSDHDHLLSVCIHHAVFDGWSENIFIDELATGYAAAGRHTAERHAGPAPLTTQYRDFAVWQRAHISTPEVQASLAAWREWLTGAPTRLNLPYDHPRPGSASGHGGRVTMTLPNALVETLRAIGRRRGATLFMTLLAAYSVVLHRYSSDREVMIGTALAGRTRPDLEALIGFFVSTVALRVNLEGEPTFVELLERVKQVSLNAQVHQDVPFDLVVEQLHPERTAGPMPFFQTIFVMENVGGARAFADLSLDPVPVHNETAKCDLVLGAVSGRDGLTCTLDYDTDLFVHDTALRLLDSYRCALDGIAADPDQSIATLPLIGASERARLAAWSVGAGAPVSAPTIHQAFEAVAARTPHAVAIVSGSESLTYAALDRRATDLAARLRRDGVQRGELVALACGRTPAAVVAQLAVLKAGAAYLPLDMADPGSRLSALIRDAGVREVLADTASADRLPREVARIVAIDGTPERQEEQGPAPDANDSGPDDLAYMMFTSGSTGRPNGVRIPHRGVLRLVLAGDYVDWSCATTFLQMAPLTFDASTFEVWGALLRGRRLVLFPERVPTLASLADVLRRERVDCLWLTTALFNSVVDERPECLDGVSQLIVGGDALSVAHIRRAQAVLPSTQIINGYGPTECTTFACCYRIPLLQGDPPGSIPIGGPIGGTRVQVLDAQRQPVPIGVVGELFVGGEGVALGYHERPRLTAERFVADPTGQTGRLRYRTGDRVRWTSAGVLEFHGRTDAQLKVRGFRVEPGEIEAACRQHPAVRDAVVVFDRRESVDAQLVTFVVGDPGAVLRESEVRTVLEERLPAYMQPAAIVPIAALPLTSNGKIDREALRALPLHGGEETTVTAPAEPRTATEAALVRIWAALLKHQAPGIHDDFFSLGGHSLLAVRMFAQIETEFGRSLPFSTLLSHATIASLAGLLEQPGTTDARSISLVPLQPQGDRPPLLLLHGIGNEVWGFRELVGCLEPDQPVFGLVSSDHASSDTDSLVERASRYATDLEALFPGGPLVIGGHCSGAVTAFEVARQLKRRGRDVPLLIVFDYWLASEPAGMAALIANAASWVTDDLMVSTLDHNIGRIRSRWRLLKARARQWMTRSAPAADVRDRMGLWRLPAREVGRLERHLDAFEAYRFERYDGPTVVFRARACALTRLQPTADLGWGRVVSAPLTVETVPGAHDSMLRTPFVSTLGARVTAALARATAAIPGALLSADVPAPSAHARSDD